MAFQAYSKLPLYSFLFIINYLEACNFQLLLALQDIFNLLYKLIHFRNLGQYKSCLG